MSGRLEALGFKVISDLWAANENELIHRFGLWARRLIAFSRAEDNRKVAGVRGQSGTIGAETTFHADLRGLADISAELRPLCETVARRLDKAGLAAAGLTLKLRHADRRIVTRACRIGHPTARAETIWRAASAVLAVEADGRPYRLVGVTATRLVPGQLADPPDLFEPPIAR
jgi:DNA polymerase-4